MGRTIKPNEKADMKKAAAQKRKGKQSKESKPSDLIAAVQKQAGEMLHFRVQRRGKGHVMLYGADRVRPATPEEVSLWKHLCVALALLIRSMTAPPLFKVGPGWTVTYPGAGHPEQATPRKGPTP